MRIINKTAEKDYFSRFQRPISCLLFILLQLAFHEPILVVTYTILTLEFNFLIELVAVMFLQMPLRRSQRVVQPLKYFPYF